MKSSTTEKSNSKKTVKVIKNTHSVAEQHAIGDRWAEHEGPRMTLAETLAYAAAQQREQSVATTTTE